MRLNDLLEFNGSVIRILDEKNEMYLVIECSKKSMPKWVDKDSISLYSAYENDNLFTINTDAAISKQANARFNMIAPILPVIGQKSERSDVINRISKENCICRQTVCRYLWLYLSRQNIYALAPQMKKTQKELTLDQKNIRWALNKFFYTKYKYSLNIAYTLMLKEKYRDENGNLFPEYPSYYQFRYFYRKYNKKEKFYISRNGLKDYQKNRRPLLGDSIREFAPIVGYGMIDATVCDIYLINDSGKLIGRPIFTACVDAYSGLCCGYALSWEGGVYSLRKLMLNIISDKVQYCKQFGIIISKSEWNCDKLPRELISDMGKEYTSDTFSQITDLGVTLTNLPAYRPDLKGSVEKFFDIIQSLYKPCLKGKGVIETDYRERGARDYRKDAILTINDFEKILIRCILYYNTKRIINKFPFTEQMLEDKVKPYSSDIWNYHLNNTDYLITVTSDILIKTLLPRTKGKFTRKGLIVNRLRYKNPNYTEQYLTGTNVIAAYNPEDVSFVWLIDNGKYIKFELIESRFHDKDLEYTNNIYREQREYISSFREDSLTAKINLIDHIDNIGNIGRSQNISMKNIRCIRNSERIKSHIDYLKESEQNV